MKAQVQPRTRKAILDIWTRIKDAVSHMVERLSDQEAVFRDTLVENIKELIDVLPRLNFTGDENITDILHAMKVLVVEPDNLRSDNSLRQAKAREADAILQRISDFLD